MPKLKMQKYLKKKSLKNVFSITIFANLMIKILFALLER